MARHTSEARKMRRDLDGLLAAVSEETGVGLQWDAAELGILDMISAGIDRKVALSEASRTPTHKAAA